MKINSPNPGWAEQDPGKLVENIKILTGNDLIKDNKIEDVKCIDWYYLPDARAGYC